MKILQVLRFERHRALKHRVQKHPETPHVDEETFVALVNDDLWREIRWSSALLLNDLTLLDYLGDAEVADLDALFTIEQNVVQFDVAVDNAAAMDV